MALSFNKEKATEHIAILYKNDKEIKNVYFVDDDDDNNEKKKEKLNHIRLNNKDENFFPAINDFEKTQQTQKVYICGESGCGKTSFIIAYCFNFHKMYPNNKILLFSSKNEDETIDKLDYIERVKITDDMLAHPYTLAEISSLSKPSLCVFDDIEDFPNKKLTKEIDRLLNEIIRNGRSYGIFCCYTHHQPSDYKQTRNLLYEATHVVTFPARCAKNSYDYLYNNKLHLNKRAINTLNNTKTNFVCIKKKIPKCIITNNYLILL